MPQVYQQATKPSHSKSKNKNNTVSRCLLAALVSGSTVLSAAIALASTPPPGTIIQNQATGSFTDPNLGTQNVESNVVSVTVAEVAGIVVSAAGVAEAPSGVTNAGPDQGDGDINPEDVVYFTFDITNVGNDPTQFFIPDAVTVTGGTFDSSTIGPIQIIAYDTDGTNTTTLGAPIDIPSGGVTTGTAIGLPEGSIASGGTVTVRVPVKADTSQGDLIVVLGDTPAGDRGNQAYIDDGNNLDVYTQDNADADSVDVPATAATETESPGAPINGDATFHRQEASATQQTQVLVSGNLPVGPPFLCDSTFYITIGPGGGTNQQLFSVNRSSETFSFTPIGPATTTGGGYPINFDYNALAYNPVDNYIYAHINPETGAPTTGPYSPGNIIKIGSDGVASSLGKPVTSSPNGTTALSGDFFAGAILSDGTYVIGRQGTFATLDLTTTPPTIINSQQSISNVRLNDFAVDPRDPASVTNGNVYAVNEHGSQDTLIILNIRNFPPTIVSEATNPTGFNHNAGSQFVDAFGVLYYRSNSTNTLYQVDTDETSPTYGVATAISSTPNGGNHDGVSCLFATAMEKTVTDTDDNAITTSPAGEIVRYVYTIATGNVLPISGVTFEDDLRSVAGGSPIEGTFTGDFTVSNGTGTATISNGGQTLQINNLTLPAQDSVVAGGETLTITADVQLSPSLAPGDYFNQSTLTNLPTQYPLSIPSDYPPTAPYEDPTPLAVTEPLATDPNLKLVKRITAIDRGLATEQLFDSSYIDVGTQSDNDNAANWPGPPISENIGSGTGTVESYLNGLSGIDDLTAVETVAVKPGERLEYTISFLSDGAASAENVFICDRIPTGTTFVPDAYNSETPAAPGSSDRGIFLSFSGNDVALTNANDGDEIISTGGYYFPPSVDPSVALGTAINCSGSNDNGAIVVDLSDIPHATADGTPTNSFGLLRFQVAVD
ncbi:MAG: hypothetical protein AAFQ74_04650 [Cyanobacteria bacterium J06623_4]